MQILLDKSKSIKCPLRRGVVETLAMASPVLDRLAFLDVASDIVSLAQVHMVSSVGFRAINKSYPENKLIDNSETVQLSILGGIYKVPYYLTEQRDLAQLRKMQDKSTAKAIALAFTKAFFKGNKDTSKVEFDGLDRLLPEKQVITSALSLAKLDELIDAVHWVPHVLYMNKVTRRKLINLMRESCLDPATVANIVPSYAGIFIDIIEDDNLGNEILADGEIYACSFGYDNGIVGLQHGDISVIYQDLRDTDYITLIEWYCGMALLHPKAAARLKPEYL